MFAASAKTNPLYNWTNDPCPSVGIGLVLYSAARWAGDGGGEGEGEGEDMQIAATHPNQSVTNYKHDRLTIFAVHMQ